MFREGEPGNYYIDTSKLPGGRVLNKWRYNAETDNFEDGWGTYNNWFAWTRIGNVASSNMYKGMSDEELLHRFMKQYGSIVTANTDYTADGLVQKRNINTDYARYAFDSLPVCKTSDEYEGDGVAPSIYTYDQLQSDDPNYWDSAKNRNVIFSTKQEGTSKPGLCKCPIIDNKTMKEVNLDDIIRLYTFHDMALMKADIIIKLYEYAAEDEKLEKGKNWYWNQDESAELKDCFSSVFDNEGGIKKDKTLTNGDTEIMANFYDRDFNNNVKNQKELMDNGKDYVTPRMYQLAKYGNYIQLGDKCRNDLNREYDFTHYNIIDKNVINSIKRLKIKDKYNTSYHIRKFNKLKEQLIFLIENYDHYFDTMTNLYAPTNKGCGVDRPVYGHGRFEQIDIDDYYKNKRKDLPTGGVDDWPKNKDGEYKEEKDVDKPENKDKIDESIIFCKFMKTGDKKYKNLKFNVHLRDNCFVYNKEVKDNSYLPRTNCVSTAEQLMGEQMCDSDPKACWELTNDCVIKDESEESQYPYSCKRFKPKKDVTVKTIYANESMYGTGYIIGSNDISDNSTSPKLELNIDTVTEGKSRTELQENLSGVVNLQGSEGGLSIANRELLETYMTDSNTHGIWDSWGKKAYDKLPS